MQKKRFPSNRKAQLTLFFLMGIFLIGVFAFVYWMGGRTREAVLEAPTEKIIADLLKTGSIPFYVGVCLEENAKDGMRLAGQQGGDIFVYQDGAAPSPTKFIPLSHHVTYGISAPFLVNKTNFPYPPGYPGGIGKSLQVPALNFNGWGRFGEVSLRKLCDVNGANSPYAFQQYGYTGIVAPICMNNIYADTLSTQWQLEMYVEKKVVNCTNWTAIREETGYNVTPTGDPNVTFRLGMNDVWVDAYIPLMLRVGGREPIFTIGDFHQRLPVRLKRIAELASYLATYDSFMLNFNLSSGYRMLDTHWDTNMHITVSTPLKAAGIWEDVVTIEDSASVIDGKNYVYRFARQNRYPALDWMHQMTNWSDFDIVVMENDTIRIDPNPFDRIEDHAKRKLYDPDEDNLTYYYTGWKETCDEVFDFVLGIPRTACSEKEPTHPENYFKFPNQGAQVSEEWFVSYLYPKWKTLPLWSPFAQFLGNGYPDEAPRNWTSSEEYKNTGRNATLVTNHTDIGPHNTTVWVCDEAGLCDYQTVRLMVFDFPQLHLNGTNPYKDIPYDRASVEDFYRLSAEGTTSYYTPLLGYIFSDKLEPFELKIDHPLQILDLPRVEFGYERDIRYIHNFTFNRSTLCKDPLGYKCGKQEDFEVFLNHTINLTITTLNIPPKKFNVSVYQCLPHRSEKYPDPWPYNQTPDAYLASHTCCSIGPQLNTTIEVPAGLTSNFVKKVPNEYGSDLQLIRLFDKDDNEVCRFSLPVPTDILGLAAWFVLNQCPNNHLAVDNEQITVTFFVPQIPFTDPLNFTLTQDAKDAANYPAWGSWFPNDKICQGGTPQIGIVSGFGISDVPYSPPDVGETVTNYQGVTFAPAQAVVAPDTWKNDVIGMLFQRFCSGWRGNVCNGKASRTFKQIDPCDDPDKPLGEIESCEGADPNMLKPSALFDMGKTCLQDADCAQTGKYTTCLDGKCYESQLPTDCQSYGGGYSGETSFEHALGLDRVSPPAGHPTKANGTCNPNPTCSDNTNSYGLDPKKNDKGRYLILGASCKAGKCDDPVDSQTIDCYKYNGRQVIDTPPDPDPKKYQWFCAKKSDTFYSLKYGCGASGDPSTFQRTATCESTQNQEDPDEEQNLCNACLFTGMIKGGWKEVQNKPKNLYCCGDDKGEGGYPYAPQGQTGSAISTSKLADAGTYHTTEQVCDDYVDTYGNKQYDPLNDKEIDNDCDNTPNCKDTDCGTKRGPNRIPCCTNKIDCNKVLFDDIVECSSNECDCKPSVPPYTSTPSTPINPYKTISNPGTAGYRMCIGTKTEFPGPTKHIRINNIPSGTHTISIELEDADGGKNCKEISPKIFVNMFVWNDQNSLVSQQGHSAAVTNTNYVTVAFRNFLADEDCILNIKIV